MPEAQLISTPFDATSTAAEVLSDVDLAGRTAIVTGATSGIGVETARALAGAGGRVTLAVRDAAAGRHIADDIAATTGNSEVAVAVLDLADLRSVSSFVDAWSGPLDILVNNAGVMAIPETRTPEGWEMQFAVNHLGHFALTVGLHDALAASGHARVVSLSSLGHQRSGIIFDDIHFHRRPYERFSAYGQSKTANVLFAVEAARRWASDAITANAVMPGAVMSPGAQAAQDSLTQEQLATYQAQPGASEMFWKTPEQGAANSVLLAASPLVDGVTGRYFEDGRQAGRPAPGTRAGVAPHALDSDAARRLWEMSLDMINWPSRSASQIPARGHDR